MTWTGLRTLWSKFRTREIAAAELTGVEAENAATGKHVRRNPMASCRIIVFGLVVMGGIGKNCCPDCRLPDSPAFSPSSLTFAPQVVSPSGPASQAQTVTLTATGKSSSLAISTITTTGDYSQTNDCPASLATGASCTIQVTFTPNAVGVIQGLVIVNGDSSSGVSLSGTGIPALGFSPASLDFGTVDPGTTSAPQTVTLTNNQSIALNIGSISTSGDYSQTNNCPASLTAGQSCAIQITFAPTVSGVVPGALTAVTDISPGTQPLGLTGTGSGSVTPNLSFSPATVAFADQEAGTSSTAQAVTLTNTSGVSSLTINTVSSSGPNYLENDNCTGQALPPGGTCTVNVTFAPVANLAPVGYPGAITVNDSDNTSPNVFGLSGTGVAPVTASPQTVDFGTVFFESQPTQTVTITNNNSADEDLSIDAPSAFSVTNNCPSSLAPRGQCTVELQYVGGVASVKGTLAVTGSSGGFLSPFIANLSACGTQVNLIPPSLNFGSVPVGIASDPQTVTITNGDHSLLNITDISVGGVDSGDFSMASNTCGSSLAAGQSCIVNTVFTPQTSTTRTATLNISDDANCSPQPISLSGGSGSGPFTVTASIIGTASGTITSDVTGINCGTNGTACSASFSSGSTVTLTATPDSGIVFVGWAGPCSGTGTCVLNMAADKQVMAVFGSNPLLNVIVTSVDNGAGTVTSSPAGINCGSACSEEFSPETQVTLISNPVAGSTFGGWNNGCGGTGTCTITMLSAQTVEAVFEAPAFSVSATAPIPATISAGKSATSTVSVSSRDGFQSVVSFVCSVTPVVALGPTCSINNITPPANGTVDGTLTINTKAPATALGPSSGRRSAVFYAAWIAIFGCVGAVIAGGRKRSNFVAILLFGVLLGGLTLQSGCGGGGSAVPSGNSGTPAGSYTISITGASGSLQSTAQLTLTVQ